MILKVTEYSANVITEGHYQHVGDGIINTNTAGKIVSAAFSAGAHNPVGSGTTPNFPTFNGNNNLVELFTDGGTLLTDNR